MAQEIEIEYKNLLNKREFDHILHSLPFPKEVQTQRNHYFETADFSLKKNGCALRIREKNDNFTLTLKEPHETGLLETHDALTKQEAYNWMNGKFTAKEHTSKQLADKGLLLDELIYLGSLVTKRRELNIDNVLLVLDYSEYNKISDYELEIEALSEESGRETMRDLLERFGITKRQTPNKIQRFYESRNNSANS